MERCGVEETNGASSSTSYVPKSRSGVALSSYFGLFFRSFSLSIKFWHRSYRCILPFDLAFNHSCRDSMKQVSDYRIWSCRITTALLKRVQMRWKEDEERTGEAILKLWIQFLWNREKVMWFLLQSSSETSWDWGGCENRTVLRDFSLWDLWYVVLRSRACDYWALPINIAWDEEWSVGDEDWFQVLVIDGGWIWRSKFGVWRFCLVWSNPLAVGNWMNVL